MNTYILRSVIVLFLFLGASSVYAQELQYGKILETDADSILIEYRSPQKRQNYMCSFDGVCMKTEEASLLSVPIQGGSTIAAKSIGGAYALSSFSVPLIQMTNYMLYDTKGDAAFLTLLPFFESAHDIRFSRNEKRILLRQSDGSLYLYDIPSRSIHHTKTGLTSMPYFSFSPDGGKASTYSYSQEGYIIWDLLSNTNSFISSNEEGIFEFSTDGTKGAFIETIDNFRSLVLVDLLTLQKEVLTKDVTVEDYIFHDNVLYYIANTSNSPYEWNLYAYDDSSRVIASNVSYGEYMKDLPGYLGFIQFEGSIAIPTLYDGENILSLNPFESPKTFEKIKREVVKTNGIYSVMWSPEQKKSDTLIVWMHGGPKRQTSYGYHPYFSYGVYDEIMKRLVEAGATIVRVDYTGSWGYGQEFMDKLNARLGSVDVSDILDVVDDVKTSRIDHVYLMGNSYGGYLALRTLVEKPKAFDGAISIAGVTDWKSLLERIPSSPFATYFGGVPHGGTDILYRQASIIDRLDTLTDEKILLVYGEQDATVPTWQSKEFFTVLEERDLDAKLISFPDEEHIIVQEKNLETLCKAISDVVDIRTSCGI